MSILAKSGRVAIAESIKTRPCHLAWGTGDGAWTSPPSEDSNATALLAEVGRREATSVNYVSPDVAGSIVTPDGNFALSGTPTSYLCFSFNFDYTDAGSSVIRETAIYLGSTMVGGLPGGQKYFVPAEVATQGRLFQLENIPPIFRSTAVRENFDIVVAF